MDITTAIPEDIPDLVGLLAALFAQEAEFRPDEEAQRRGLARIIGDPALGEILIAREAGRALGMVNLLYTVSTALGERVALLEDMVVAPDGRGAGTGTRLLQAALERARQAGCRRVTLLTDEDNHAAQRFYARQGFALSGMRPMRLALD